MISIADCASNCDQSDTIAVRPLQGNGLMEYGTSEDIVFEKRKPLQVNTEVIELSVNPPKSEVKMVRHWSVDPSQSMSGYTRSVEKSHEIKYQHTKVAFEESPEEKKEEPKMLFDQSQSL